MNKIRIRYLQIFFIHIIANHPLSQRVSMQKYFSHTCAHKFLLYFIHISIIVTLYYSNTSSCISINNIKKKETNTYFVK